VSLRKILAKVLVFAVLEVGALGGVPMTPEKIEELLQMTNRARAEHVVKTDVGGGLPPLE
jgi:hypothetical protein